MQGWGQHKASNLAMGSQGRLPGGGEVQALVLACSWSSVSCSASCARGQASQECVLRGWPWP